jgi:hypothetical protein
MSRSQSKRTLAEIEKQRATVQAARGDPNSCTSTSLPWAGAHEQRAQIRLLARDLAVLTTSEAGGWTGAPLSSRTPWIKHALEEFSQ